MKMKLCIKCKKELPATSEYFYNRKDSKDGFRNDCKECHYERIKIYRKTEDGKNARKRYYKSDRAKELHVNACKKYYNTDNGKSKIISYQQSDEGRESHNKANKKYKKSEKGKISILKENSRRRNMNYVQLIPNPFSVNEDIDWHHIDDKYVVALPRDLHRLYMGKYHKDNVMIIVKQIYLENIELTANVKGENEVRKLYNPRNCVDLLLEGVEKYI